MAGGWPCIGFYELQLLFGWDESRKHLLQTAPEEEEEEMEEAVVSPDYVAAVAVLSQLDGIFTS